jgi:hypothetical protein
MSRILRLSAVTLSCALLGSCGAVNGGIDFNACTVTAAVIPSNATADHSMLPPGNQVQFSTTSTVTGNCPLIPDRLGSWSTSDPVNTTISNDAPTQGRATCLSATTSPATISNSGTVRGHTFTRATLTCK